MVHELKILPEYFKDVLSGKKGFEIRKADRPFHTGDLLALNEYNAENKCYTGNSCLVYIDYIFDNKEYCKSGYVILGIKPCVVYRCDMPGYNHIKGGGLDYSVPYATKESEVVTK